MIRALLGALALALLAPLTGGGHLAPLLPGAAAEAAGQSRSMVIEEFRAYLRVHENGDLDVREEIRVRFEGAWNGIYREIPVEYRSPSGLPYRLHLDVESVTAPDGTPLRHEVGRRGDYRRIKVWVPNARDAVRTVSIHYTSPNALRFHREGEEGFAESFDELYWNVTGTEWEVPILRASALVSLPAETQGRRARAFTGPWGSADTDARIEETREGFFLESESSLPPGEGLTVAVAWDPGVVEPPSVAERAGLALSIYWPLGLPFLAFAVMLRLWWTRGRDPSPGSIVPRYQPPEDMTPGEIGTLVDASPDTRDVTATLVDLAVRGHLRIEEVEQEKILGIFGGKPDWRLVQRTPDEEWTELQPHERTLLRGVFKTPALHAGGPMDSVLLSDLEDEFYKTLDRIRTDLYRELLDRGHYDHRPDRVQRSYLVAGILLVGFGIPLGGVAAEAVGMHGGVAAAGLALSGLPVLLFSFIMPAPTVRGARRRAEVLGFQEFLERVEEDRFRRMITSPEQFERYLPHAMALGVDRKWAKAFEGLEREPPDWYVGRHPAGFRPTVFVGTLDSFSSRVGSAMTSQPRSSGGSGFSGGGGGGGFSGGGFGGGGGGGF